MSAVERDPAAQATLWRQRVFEVHAAMSAYVAERHRREDLGTGWRPARGYSPICRRPTTCAPKPGRRCSSAPRR
ncbi:hypothetical protein P4234_17925 [Pseudomonas aeruginosa]|nr:hypothetical protein [Pseudomonas aeruginosa]